MCVGIEKCNEFLETSLNSFRIDLLMLENICILGCSWKVKKLVGKLVKKLKSWKVSWKVSHQVEKLVSNLKI